MFEEVHFEANEDEKVVAIPLAEDDVFPEGNKTFEVYLSASQGVFISPFGYAFAVILNDDPPLPGTYTCTCMCVECAVKHFLV